MPEKIIGPLKIIPDCFGHDVPLYALKYDEEGDLLSPLSLEHLLAYINDEEVTDVIFYSHGWNNTFPDAEALYETFLKGVSAMAGRRPGLTPPGFKPVFAGTIWPSTILVWPSERAPDIAALPTIERYAEALTLLSPDLRARVENSLIAGGKLTAEDAGRMAEQLAAAFPGPVLDEAGEGPYAPSDLLGAWQALLPPDTAAPANPGGFDDYGAAPGAAVQGGGPAAAGVTDFDPRMVLRAATVLMMKDRAGVVGANGVAATLGRLLDGAAARLHLFGHSYGAKVVTTALTRANAGRPARSLTLMQPAINHRAFWPDVNGAPGGFHAALSLVERPVLATFSEHDVPLHDIFHLVCRRASDLGELLMAGQVSRFAALGGYGPLTTQEGFASIPLPAEGTPYPQQPAPVRFVALDGATGIDGHGDVNTPWTWWAALTQLS